MDFKAPKPTGTGTVTVSWKTNVQPYVKSEQVLICPSAPVVKNIYGGVQVGNANYGANVAVIISASAYSSLSSAAVVSPATTYMIMDSGNSVTTAYQAYHPDASNVNYLPGTGPGSASNLTASVGSGTAWKGWTGVEDDFVSGRHFGGVNMTFADG